MTLLFFLRSPAGNADTGAFDGGDAGRYWDQGDEAEKPKRKKKLTAKEMREFKALAKRAAEEADKKAQKRRRIKDEEALLMLFMHDFEGYDD